MKVGILTCHSTANYGASLQLYATAKTLEDLGHEVIVYDNRDHAPGKCRDFVTKHMKLTRTCRTDDEFRSETLRLGINTILVGSDAVLWFFIPTRSEGYGAYPNPFWLRWARDLPVKKVLMAASSMGLMFPRIGPRHIAEIRGDLAEFDYISVRDRWTKSFMTWVGAKNVELIFDPTSCLPSFVHPDRSSLPAGLEKGKYIILTFSQPDLADEWLTQMTKKANRAGMKTVFIPHPDRECMTESVDVVLEQEMDPLEWLSLLGSAAGYVGERFHPIVLSAFYGIPFWSCDYYSRSGILSVLNNRSKTYDFCRRIGAEQYVSPSKAFFNRVKPDDILLRIDHKVDLSITAYQGQFLTAMQRAISCGK